MFCVTSVIFRNSCYKCCLGAGKVIHSKSYKSPLFRSLDASLYNFAVSDLGLDAKSSPACSVLTSRSLATASNSGDSSASHAHAIPGWPLSRNWITLSLSLTLRPKVSRPVCLGIKQPFGAYDQIFITVREMRVCWCGTLSLTRGRVCHLQLLLALASAVILGSESRGTRDRILLSQIRDFPSGRILRLAGSRWRCSNPPPHRIELRSKLVPLITLWHGSRRKQCSFIVACVYVAFVTQQRQLFTEAPLGRVYMPQYSTVAKFSRMLVHLTERWPRMLLMWPVIAFL
jgi:hypothetical protein